MRKPLVRCPWCEGIAHCPEMVDYHDREWGVPARDDRTQFEFLVLESAQAGLSWTTILRKREGYRRAFADFDAERVAAFTAADEARLLTDAGIVRNRLKIAAAVNNARCFLDIAARHGSFSDYIWSFVDGKPIRNAWTGQNQIPATTPLSDGIAKELKRLGFKFLGSTVLYAHLQATGLVNDHLVSCFRHRRPAKPRNFPNSK